LRYPYRCACGNIWDVVKSVRRIDDPEFCPMCGSDGERFLAPGYFCRAGDWNDPQYNAFNPGLGQVVRSRSHKQELCRRMGVEEVGNDFGGGERMTDHFEKERAEMLDKRWDSV